MKTWIALALIVLVATATLASTVWIGADNSPRRLKLAYEIINGVNELPDNPTDPQLDGCLTSILPTEQEPTPANTACKFEYTLPPAYQDICGDDNACQELGKAICEKRANTGRKAAQVFADFCIIACADKPVKDNPTLFWLAVECP